MSNFFEWRDAPTAQYAVVGDPVEHSLSPGMHNAAFEALGMPDRYVAVRVPKEEFSEAVAHLKEKGYKGVNVTVPLKDAAYRWADKKPRFEQRVGAVNTLRLETKEAINTDAPGFIDTLRDLGIVFPCNVLVMGAGGTAHALILALAEHNCHLKCWNRTRTKLEKLLHQLGLKVEVVDQPVPNDCQLILNTTSASMDGAHLPVDWYQAPRKAIAYDVFYTQGPTTFMFDAQSNGIRAVDGRALLVAQGVRSFEWWTGTKPPKEAMLKAVE
jgi:shikimate dehydrogenase